MRIAIALMLALALAGAAFAESNNLDAVCSAAGFGPGIAHWQFKNNDGWTQQSAVAGAAVTVTGTNEAIEWTSSPAAAAVLVNAASNEYAGGTSGSISLERGNLQQLYFCSEAPVDVPEFGLMAAGLVMIAGIGLIVMRRN